MIIFRADGNKEIGTGHIMRCLSIADAFNEIGEKCAFITADGSMQPLIENRGYSTFVLDTDFKDMMSDLEQTISLLEAHNSNIIILDSYFVTANYLNSISKVAKTAYIDDLSLFAYPVDLLINYNIYADQKEYETMYLKSNVPYPQMLIGTDFVPLRKMFRDIPQRPIGTRVNDVLISTGGTDPIHLSCDLINTIKTRSISENITFHFLIGTMNSDKKVIEEAANNINNIKLHYNVSDMKSFISSCDLVVSAAGTTLYEICACGVPLITYILADNQIKSANAFEKEGIAVCCGDLRNRSDKSNILLDSIKELIGDYDKRRMISNRMLKLVDGNGASNICKAVQLLKP